MGSVTDYLLWRGDLEFDRDPLNEVDGLIFSILSYMDLEGAFAEKSKEEGIRLRDAVQYLEDACRIMREDDLPFLKEIPDFLEAAAKTKRFGNVVLSHFVEQLDRERTKQFSATTYTLEDRVCVVAFRGTDDSLAGWKEDLEMGFKEEVPAQLEGKRYLTERMEEMEGTFHVVGHSKGGNVAIYAGATIPEEQKDRIRKIYNYDGPGFHRAFIESQNYKNVLSRVTTILPESSVVGVLLEQKSKYKAVRCSTGLALMQHDPFLWLLEGNHFLEAGKLSKKSMSIRSTLQSWLQQLTPEEQSKFIDGIFSVLEESGIQSFADVTKDTFSVVQGVLKAYSKTDEETKEHMKKVMDLLWDEGGKTLTKSIVTDIGVFFAKNSRKLSKITDKSEKNEKNKKETKK